ncbi:hypothetical protein ABID29_001954 [Streptococcus rupicaprae]|uniref:Uncharacterized protein n=1 Tax=Streptococcus rupicaprae TaxID=759619 RepID=A0ABV2FJS2_9STRE
MSKLGHLTRSKKGFITFAIGYSLLTLLYLYSFLIAKEDLIIMPLYLFWMIQTVSLSQVNRTKYQVWAMRLVSIELALVTAVQVYAGFARPVFYIFAGLIFLLSFVKYPSPTDSNHKE